MIGAPAVGTALDVQVQGNDRKASPMVVTLVRIDPDAPSTDRYVLRVDHDPRGRFGHEVGDEIAVEEQWFTERAKLWPREGGVRISPPRTQIVDLFTALKESLK